MTQEANKLDWNDHRIKQTKSHMISFTYAYFDRDILKYFDKDSKGVSIDADGYPSFAIRSSTPIDEAAYSWIAFVNSISGLLSEKSKRESRHRHDDFVLMCDQVFEVKDLVFGRGKRLKFTFNDDVLGVLSFVCRAKKQMLNKKQWNNSND